VVEVLSHLSIRTKVAGAFALIFLATIALGGFAAMEMSGVGNALDHLRRSALQSADLLGRMEGQMEHARSFDAQILLIPERRQSLLDRAQAAEKELQASIALLRSTVDSPEEARLVATFIAAHQRYWEQRLAMLAPLGRGDEAGAMAIFRDTATASQAQRDALVAEIDLDRGNSDAQAAGAVAASDSARLWIMAGVSLLGLLCLAAGVVLINTICRPIAGLTDAMSRLAAHDLTVTIDGDARQDEIGRMARTMAVFRQSLGAAGVAGPCHDPGRHAARIDPAVRGQGGRTGRRAYGSGDRPAQHRGGHDRYGPGHRRTGRLRHRGGKRGQCQCAGGGSGDRTAGGVRR
jgi:methyl-accepting chemotaxis protein